MSIADIFVKKNRKIIYDAPGQTCNRLWSYIDTIGWAIRSNGQAIIWFWDKDLQHFDNLRNSRYVRFPFYSPRLIKFFGHKRYQKILHKLVANSLIRPLYRRSTGRFVAGWDKRASAEHFPHVQELIRQIYRPNQHIIDHVSPIVESYRQKGYYIIGVHIRGGDYKWWFNGRYYFEPQEYKRQMQAVARLHSDKKVCFAISTNERIDHTLFNGLEIMQIENPTAIHDLYMLSQCDKIIGPLSTFSRWASFYGNVPLCFIDRDKEVTLDSFSVIKDFYHFENGTEIINLTDLQK